jgi:hypothetical protein
LGGDPRALLEPFLDTLVNLTGQQRYEEAASVRDEAEQLRNLLIRHRGVESLRAAGKLTLDIEGEGQVGLDGGLLVGGGFSTESVPVQEGDEVERRIVSQWLLAHADRVRIVDVGSHLGLCMPVTRIPSLAELLRELRANPATDSISQVA